MLSGRLLLLGRLLFGTALLQGEELFASKGLVVDLCGGFDEVLQVRSGQKVSEVYKLAVAFVFDIDDTVPVLPAPDLFTVDDDRAFAADDGKRDECTHALVQLAFLFLVVFVIERVDADVVVLHLGTDSFLEQIAFVHSERVRLGDHRNHVDHIAQLLHHRDVDRAQSMTRRVDEEETAVNARIDNVPIAHRGELLSEVSRMLILDVLDDRVPAIVVVHLVAVARGVDDVQSKPHTVFHNHVRNRVDLGGLANHLIRCESSLGIDQMRCKQRVDERRFAQSRLTHDHDVKLEAALEQFRLDLFGDRVESDVRLQRSVLLILR